MVPIGPKKGGGFVVVPLNYGGVVQTRSKMFEDKSGTIHNEQTNGYLTPRIYVKRKTVPLRQSKNFLHDQTMTIQTNDSAEFMNFEVMGKRRPA